MLAMRCPASQVRLTRPCFPETCHDEHQLYALVGHPREEVEEEVEGGRATGKDEEGMPIAQTRTSARALHFSG